MIKIMSDAAVFETMEYVNMCAVVVFMMPRIAWPSRKLV